MCRGKARGGRLVLVFSMLVVSLVGVAPAAQSSASSRVLLTRPPFGYSKGVLRTALSSQESVVLSRMAKLSLSLIPNWGISDVNVEWHVEPSASPSPIYKMQKKVLLAAQQILFRYTLIDGWPVNIVVGRTQQFIKSQLANLGCSVALPEFNGVVLMGATVCNRRVIVINLTGYLFLYRASQSLTTAMEIQQEPALSRIPYLIVDRDIAGLAHEWAHVYRAWGARGDVQTDEPAWMREGWAEVIGGLARVKAYPTKYSYEAFHAISLRHFYDWQHNCAHTIGSYRDVNLAPRSCQYTVGALAVEYLLAHYGGPSKLLLAYRYENITSSFIQAFKSVYGFPLEFFEHEVDRYLATIRRVS